MVSYSKSSSERAQTVPEDLSAGETGRSIQRIERTLDKLDGKVDGLDNKVDNWRDELLELKHSTAANTKAISAIEATRKVDFARQENRRWMIYLSIFVAVLAFLSQLYFARGGT